MQRYYQKRRQDRLVCLIYLTTNNNKIQNKTPTPRNPAGKKNPAAGQQGLAVLNPSRCRRVLAHA